MDKDETIYELKRMKTSAQRDLMIEVNGTTEDALDAAIELLEKGMVSK